VFSSIDGILAGGERTKSRFTRKSPSTPPNRRRGKRKMQNNAEQINAKQMLAAALTPTRRELWWPS
jgi:hypothetical protein